MSRDSEEENTDLEQADYETLRARFKQLSKEYQKLSKDNQKLSKEKQKLSKVFKQISEGIQELTSIVEKEAPHVSLHVLNEVRKVKTNISVGAPELQISMLSSNGAESESQSDAQHKSTTTEPYLHLGQSLKLFPLVSFS